MLTAESGVKDWGDCGVRLLSPSPYSDAFAARNRNCSEYFLVFEQVRAIRESEAGRFSWNNGNRPRAAACPVEEAAKRAKVEVIKRSRSLGIDGLRHFHLLEDVTDSSLTFRHQRFYLDPCKHRNGSLTFYRSLWQLLIFIRKSLNIFLTSPIRGRYFNLRLATPLPPLLWPSK